MHLQHGSDSGKRCNTGPRHGEGCEVRRSGNCWSGWLEPGAQALTRLQIFGPCGEESTDIVGAGADSFRFRPVDGTYIVQLRWWICAMAKISLGRGNANTRSGHRRSATRSRDSNIKLFTYSPGAGLEPRNSHET